MAEMVPVAGSSSLTPSTVATPHHKLSGLVIAVLPNCGIPTPLSVLARLVANRIWVGIHSPFRPAAIYDVAWPSLLRGRDSSAAMADRVDRRGNRHIDRETLRQQRGGSSGFHPFGDGDALAEHILELAPLPQRDAERIIARLRRGAGQDEIAETRKPHQRFGAPAFRRREPHHFREAARDEGGARIVAE